MSFKFENFTKYLVIMFTALFLAACETTPKDDVLSSASTSSSAAVEVVDGVYVGSESIEMLAVDVPDRVFFAYDSYSLTLSLIHI